ncbi:MAG: type II toxin-antitoxin system YafQ family toxin [Lachnospiraceae bacterium]|nr:type II toxin-antitoxin system YafQ family toxin [Lachnospiraceae bacterium]
MLKVKNTAQFKKDYKRCVKQGQNMELLKEIVSTLAIPMPLEEKNHQHGLRGKYSGFQECHIAPDWILIYRYDGDYLELARTGTHANLFGI